MDMAYVLLLPEICMLHRAGPCELHAHTAPAGCSGVCAHGTGLCVVTLHLRPNVLGLDESLQSSWCLGLGAGLARAPLPFALVVAHRGEPAAQLLCLEVFVGGMQGRGYHLAALLGSGRLLMVVGKPFLPSQSWLCLPYGSS